MVSVDAVDVSAPGTALTSAIKAMNNRSWKVLHREAWRQLNLEEDRRGQGLTEGTIRLTRQAWNNLPDTIRGYISVKADIPDVCQRTTGH
jgi:hypothetical protein